METTSPCVLSSYGGCGRPALSVFCYSRKGRKEMRYDNITKKSGKTRNEILLVYNTTCPRESTYWWWYKCMLYSLGKKRKPKSVSSASPGWRLGLIFFHLPLPALSRRVRPFVFRLLPLCGANKKTRREALVLYYLGSVVKRRGGGTSWCPPVHIIRVWGTTSWRLSSVVIYAMLLLP